MLVGCHAQQSPNIAQAPIVSSPPPPSPSDWKGLFDSDAQPYDVPAPLTDTTRDLLRQNAGCDRVLTTASGAFTSATADERAYLLACGAQQRLVIASESEPRTRVALDLPEDLLETAGDLDQDGTRELLVIAHAGAHLDVRVLKARPGAMSVLYALPLTIAPCSHVVVSYHTGARGLEFRVDEQPARCSSQ